MEKLSEFISTSQPLARDHANLFLMKKTQTIFLSKIGLHHFSPLTILQLCVQNQKNPMMTSKMKNIKVDFHCPMTVSDFLTLVTFWHS